MDAKLEAQLKAVDERVSAAERALNQPPPATTATTAAVGAQTAPVSWWSNTQAMTISSVVLLFGLVVFALATYLLKAGKEFEAVLRVFGTIMIVFLAVFLVVAGYSDTQIAPVMGLLGTIAGYLLGRHVESGSGTAAGSAPPSRERPPA